MSLLDKIRSYAETRSPAGEPLPNGAFNYGEMRDLWRLLNELGTSKRLEVEARLEDYEASTWAAGRPKPPEKT